MQFLKRLLQAVLPSSTYKALVEPYHHALAFYVAARYGFPARKLKVIAVTGTKGKSSVTEMIAAILESAGHKVMVSSTIHFKVGPAVRPNLYKMTLPGRGFIQKLLAEAVAAQCEYAVIEITSEAAVQYRHLFLSLDALVFTNLQKEHLESHGGMDLYFRAKMRIGEELVKSKKRPRAVIANIDDEYGTQFFALPVEEQISVSKSDAERFTEEGIGVSFSLDGVLFSLPHPGIWSALNAIAAAKTARFFGIPLPKSAETLRALTLIRGRAERIEVGQKFMAVVDYAHTPDSLRALYDSYPGHRRICVLGNTGGGRDSWKRPEMGTLADLHCEEVILTNEDPYDEDPRAIIDAMAAEMKRPPTIIMDRREAIREALTRARPNDVVLITGKGTDPFIMGAKGAKTPWDDATVVREELKKLVS